MANSSPTPTLIFKSNLIVVKKMTPSYSQEQRSSQENEDETADLEKALVKNVQKIWGTPAD